MLLIRCMCAMIAGLLLGASASAQPADAGGYLELDGVDDWVSAPGEYVYEAMTVEAWVRPTAVHPLYSAGVIGYGSRDKSSFDFGIGPQGDTRLRFFINYNQGQRTITGNRPIELGQWRHVAATYDGQTARLYVDGELDAEKVFDEPILPSGPEALLAVGNDYPGSSEFVGGSIDEVRLWSVVRSQGEIQATMFTPLSGDEPGLEVYYRFDECGSQVAVDRAPAGRHGRLGATYSAGPDDPVRMVYALSRRRCVEVGSSRPGQVRLAAGLIHEQLGQLNAGPPTLGWADIANRHQDMHVRDAFECGEHLDKSFVDSDSYLDGADEVTLDNCGSAFYRFGFTLPALVRNAAVYGVANADDLGRAYVGDRPVSPALTMQDVTDLGADRTVEGHPVLGWPSADPFFAEQGLDEAAAGDSSITIGVCGDASEFEPTGVEFQAVIQYDCLADWNADGGIDTSDVLAYQNAWSDADPETDLNADGAVNTSDILLWLNLWVARCPE